MRYVTTGAKWQCKECLIAGAGAVVLAASLPLLGIAAFLFRPFVLGAVLLAIVLVVSPWVLVPRQRGRWSADVAPEQAYRGLRLARDVVLHPGHTWAWFADDIVVGADDIVQAALGPVEEIQLPTEGSRVRRGEPLFRLRHGARTLELPSPVSGEVVRCNRELLSRPDLVNRRPFSLGWVARIHGEDPQDDRRRLLRGRRAWGWFRAEVDRVLRAAPAGRSSPGAAPAPTGEAAASDLYRRIADDAWRDLEAAATGQSARRAAPA